MNEMQICANCGSIEGLMIWDKFERCYVCRPCYIQGIIEIVMGHRKKYFRGSGLLPQAEFEATLKATDLFNKLRAAQLSAGTVA